MSFISITFNVFKQCQSPTPTPSRFLLLALADKYPLQHQFACSSPSLKYAPCSHLHQQLGFCFVCCSFIGTGGERGLEPRCSIGSKSVPSPVTGQIQLQQLPGEAMAFVFCRSTLPLGPTDCHRQRRLMVSDN